MVSSSYPANIKLCSSLQNYVVSQCGFAQEHKNIHYRELLLSFFDVRAEKTTQLTRKFMFTSHRFENTVHCNYVSMKTRHTIYMRKTSK